MTKKAKGLNLVNVLTIVFIVLKLTKLIDWSWFWVLSPTLIPLMLVMVGYLILIIVTIFLKKKN